MSEIGPASLPFHVARTYGVRQAGGIAPLQAGRPTELAVGADGARAPAKADPALNDPGVFQGGLKVRPMSPLAAARVARQVDLGEAAAAEVDRATLSSGRAVRSDGSAGSAALADHAMQLYRHPADKNAAATALQAGRLVDREA